MKLISISYSLLGLLIVDTVAELVLKTEDILNRTHSEIIQKFPDKYSKKDHSEDHKSEELFSSNVLKCEHLEAYLTVPQLIQKYGYPVEVHTVQTPDGYLLEMHRLPRKGGIPVLLMHGVLDSSAGWVIMGPQRALAYILYDLGYDVWLGNCRGNTYGRKHVFFSVKSNKFWDFSFHEMGVYDLPEIIDYMEKYTHRREFHYVSHSQGSTIFLVMCHHREGYCNRTISMNALSPVAFLDHMQSPLIKGLSKILYSLKMLSKILGVKEILPSNELMRLGGQLLCKKESITQVLCTNIMFLTCGYDSEQLNRTMLPSIMGHIPAGSSVKQLVHFGQLVRSGKFQMYDYGYISNLIIYGSVKPPLYDLSKVTASITMHYSMNDWISDQRDVLRLYKQLPIKGEKYLVSSKKFNHLDFMIGMNAKEMVYDQVINTMKMSEDKENII